LRERIRRLRREMERRGLDTFIVTQNLRYLTGTTAGKAVIVPLDRAPILLCSRLEQEQARGSWIRDVRAFSSWEAPLRPRERVFFREPWQLMADCLRELGARSIGYDRASRALIRKIRGVHLAAYRELPELVLELRKVKSRGELSLLKKSARIATMGMRAAADLIAAGRTELEIAGEVEHTMRRAGSEGVPFPTIVASGRNSWLPHGTATTKELRRGELVVVDLGAFYGGYASDMTRTFALNPTPKQLRLIEVVKRAQKAGIARVADGAKASAVDNVARKEVFKAGYSRYSPHGTGHGIGIEIHEPPSLAPNSKDVLKAGMVITVEPGVYVPRVGGARWEDMVFVTKSGCKSLTER
jgi:Xaa-Pro aminopeptidase